MATKKNLTAEAEIIEEEIAEQTAEKAAPEDEWAEEVEVMVPRKRKDDDPQYYVCVNDRRYGFPANGKKQKMPKPIAEILMSSIEAEYAAEEYADEMNRHAAEAAAGLK